MKPRNLGYVAGQHLPDPSVIDSVCILTTCMKHVHTTLHKRL